MSPATTSAALFGTKFCFQNAIIASRVSALAPTPPFRFRCSRTDGDRHRAPRSRCDLKGTLAFSRCCTSWPSRLARCRSISAAGNDGCSAISAARSSVAAKFFFSERAAIVDASIELSVFSVAPSCALSSAICIAFASPCPGRAETVKLARPGISGGFARCPLRTTRFAETIGSPCDRQDHVRPLGSCAVCGTGS